LSRRGRRSASRGDPGVGSAPGGVAIRTTGIIPTRWDITPIIGRCVALVSCDHPCSGRSHSVDVPGATGSPEAERPQGRKRPAQVKSGGELKSTRRPRREPRPVWSRRHGLKPNPERMINGPAATLTLRRRVPGAGENRLIVGKTARCSDRGDEPGSRDEWAT
jgi:hypothetical protein